MFKVNVKNLQNEITHSATFPSEEEAMAWVAQVSPPKSWGKPERWVAEDQLEKEGEDPAQAIELMVEPTSFGDIKLYKFAGEFTTEVVDISAEVAAQNKLAERAKKRSFGEKLIDKISTMNDAKNLTTEQVDAFMSNALIISLREHLWAGNIETFIAKLEASDVSAFFTAEEKAGVISECQAFLASLGG